MEKFNYNEAFKRNIGILTPENQEKIKKFRIAIPGMGGVGGIHLINLSRIGFEKFNIADLDKYELKNFNRQYGSNITTVNKDKVKVMEKYAKEINPNSDIKLFEKGVNKENIDEFLKDVDLVIDGFDVFEQKIRRLVFNRALEKNIPIITAGPIGMGCTYSIFMPGGMNYDQFFNVNENSTEEELFMKFLLGISPKLLHVKYLHKEYISLKDHKVPSLSPSVNLATGAAGVEAVKILLKIGKVEAVPTTHQFDAYRNKYKKAKLYFGNKGPIQRLKYYILNNFIKY